jgi:hypothetical protein
MKKLLVSLLLYMILISGNFLFSFPFITISVVNAERETPPYAKWSSLAMKKTKEKYPNAQIVDYLHIGRDKGTNSSTEKFKLWLKENSKEFGVYVNIEFDTETERVLNITFKETSR